MIDVFKKFAPRYKRLVRRLALDVWKDRLTKKSESKFFDDAERFQRSYERALTQHYRDKDIRIFPGTIREKGEQWLESQRALVDSIKVIATAKKDKLTGELFEKLRKDQSGDVQKMLNRIYLEPGDKAEVYRVFSFAESLEAKAEQIGDQAAFDLGQEINRAVIQGIGDRYKWQTQEDSRVRKTHRMLNKKTFLYSDPPTTVDKGGRRHTGNPGSEWGCRCYEESSNGKPLRGYVVKE